MIKIQGRTIECALIVDDEEEARDAYEYAIEDMELKPQKVTGPLDSIDKFVDEIQSNEAVLCDFHLKKCSYANWDGDQLVASCIKAGIPSVLCTAITDPPIRLDLLRYIPGLLKTGTPGPSRIRKAWEKCLLEIDGEFDAARKPWRTLVRIVDLDQDHKCIYAVVPAWNVSRKVKIDMDSLPSDIQALAMPDRRFHAQVNTGATDHRELFFDEWEPN